MKFPWVRAAIASAGGYIVQRLIGHSVSPSDVPEVYIGKTFHPHPKPVYRELIVQELAGAGNVKKVREARNFIAQNPQLVDEAYDSSTPPDAAARQIDVLRDSSTSDV